MYAAVFLNCLIRAAVILFASLAVMPQFPVPYNGAGRTSAFYGFMGSFLWQLSVV